MTRASAAALFGAAGADACFATRAAAAVAAPSVPPAAVAAPGATPAAVAAPASPPPAATHDPGGPVLELDGVFVGVALGISGGSRFFDVKEAATGTAMPNKSPAALHVTPLELTVATGMSARFYDWVGGFLVGKNAPRKLAIYSYAGPAQPARRLVLGGCVIAGVSVSPLDRSSTIGSVREPELNSGPPATMTIVVAPQTSVADVVVPYAIPAWPARPAWPASSFSLMIKGYESVAPMVKRIEGIGATFSAKSPFVEVGNLRVTIPDVAADPFYRWLDAPAEVPGQIQFPSTSASIDLINVGVVQVTSTIQTVTGSVGSPPTPTSRIVPSDAVVELYCEQMRFNPGRFAVA